MQISLEKVDKNAIQAYSESEIKVNDTTYTSSLIVSQSEIMTHWPVHDILELNETLLNPVIELQPEVIIVGHHSSGYHPPVAVLQLLAKQRVGFEFMTVGAACRTYNVLLSEQRRVALGLILPSQNGDTPCNLSTTDKT